MISLFVVNQRIPTRSLGESPPRRGIDGNRSDAEEGRERSPRMARNLNAEIGNTLPRPGERMFAPPTLKAGRINPEVGAHPVGDPLHRQCLPAPNGRR